MMRVSFLLSKFISFSLLKAVNLIHKVSEFQSSTHRFAAVRKGQVHVHSSLKEIWLCNIYYVGRMPSARR